MTRSKRCLLENQSCCSIGQRTRDSSRTFPDFLKDFRFVTNEDITHRLKGWDRSRQHSQHLNNLSHIGPLAVHRGEVSRDVIFPVGPSKTKAWRVRWRLPLEKLIVDAWDFWHLRYWDDCLEIEIYGLIDVWSHRMKMRRLMVDSELHLKDWNFLCRTRRLRDAYQHDGLFIERVIRFGISNSLQRLWFFSPRFPSFLYGEELFQLLCWLLWDNSHKQLRDHSDEYPPRPSD